MKRKKSNKPPAKSRHVDLRVDQKTYDNIAFASAEMGITVSEYIRQMLAKGKIVRKEYIVVNPESLNEILYHLAHVSGNLNQIARYYNGGGLRSREMYERIEGAISDLYDIKREIIRMGGEKLGDSEASGD